VRRPRRVHTPDALAALQCAGIHRSPYRRGDMVSSSRVLRLGRAAIADGSRMGEGSPGRHRPTLPVWNPPEADLLNFNLQVGDTVKVGSYAPGASIYGALDMAGNVWEWTADWYGADYYSNSPSENPQGPSAGNVRVLRGGAWNVEARAVRAANRFWAFPGRNDLDGFRCARSQ